MAVREWMLLKGLRLVPGCVPGDVLLAIGNIQIADIKQFDAILSKLDKSSLSVCWFIRGEWAQYAVIRPVVK